MNTNKRFWCLDEYKGETSPIVDGKFAPTNEWLCNKLNELNYENEQLKQQNKGLRETIGRQNDWEKKAITEIEQLKQQIQQLKQWNKCLAEKRHNELKGDVK